MIHSRGKRPYFSGTLEVDQRTFQQLKRLSEPERTLYRILAPGSREPKTVAWGFDPDAGLKTPYVLKSCESISSDGSVTSHTVMLALYPIPAD